MFGYETVSQRQTLQALKDAAREMENTPEGFTTADLLEPEDQDLFRRILAKG